MRSAVRDRFITLIRSTATDDSGATLAQYAVIGAIVASVAIGPIAGVGTTIAGLLDQDLVGAIAAGAAGEEEGDSASNEREKSSQEKKAEAKAAKKSGKRRG